MNPWDLIGNAIHKKKRFSAISVVLATSCALFLTVVVFAAFSGSLDPESLAKFISDKSIKSLDELLKQQLYLWW